MRAAMVLAVLTVLGTALTAVPAVPAAAAVTLTSVTVQTAKNDDVTKTGRAFCPAGKVVYGGGANLITLSPLVTGVKISSVTPFGPTSDGRYGVLATAIDADFPFSIPHQDWGLTIKARCGNALPGYQLLRATSASDSYPLKRAQVRCPGGRVPLAAGGTVRTPTYVSSPITFLGTTVSGGYVEALATEKAGGSYESWSVSVQAVCVTRPAGYTVVKDFGLANRSDYKGNNTPPCPSGTKVYGGGGFVSYNPGDPYLLQYETLPSLREQSLTAYWDPATPGYRSWAVNAYALCAA